MRTTGVWLGLDKVVSQLRAARERWRSRQQRPLEVGGRELPTREVLSRIVEGLRGALFPMRLGPPDLRQESEDYFVGHTLDTVLAALLGQVRLELRYHARHEKTDGRVTKARALTVVREFATALPAIRKLLDSDVLGAYHGDPAALSVDEVLLCCPGVQAMIHHRIAHRGRVGAWRDRHRQLGRVTIGRGSSIGGNVWLTRSVPPGSHLTQAQSREAPSDETVAAPAPR